MTASQSVFAYSKLASETLEQGVNFKHILTSCFVSVLFTVCQNVFSRISKNIFGNTFPKIQNFSKFWSTILGQVVSWPKELMRTTPESKIPKIRHSLIDS